MGQNIVKDDLNVRGPHWKVCRSVSCLREVASWERRVIIAPNGSEPAKDLSVLSVLKLMEGLEGVARDKIKRLDIKILPSREKAGIYQNTDGLSHDKVIVASSQTEKRACLKQAAIIIGVDSSAIALANL